VSQTQTRPFILGVLQRIEYRYGNKEQLLAPKLDGERKFGTYGMIDLTTIFWYPSIPGRLYHPVDNKEEAEWWLEFYKENSEFVRAFFVPSPEQRETGSFTVPDLGEYTIPDPGDDWYSKGYEADAYSK
jgi:hypothetical protein